MTVQGAAPGQLRNLVERIAETGAAAWIVVLCLAAAIGVESSLFLSSRNIANLLSETVVLGLVTVGEALVMLAGQIDLSVGSLASLTAMLSAGLINGRSDLVAPVLLLVLALGAVVGAIQGTLVTRFRVNSFIVTLGSYYALQGLAFAYSQTPVGSVPDWLANIPYLGAGPLPAYFVGLLLLIAVVSWVLRRTVVGRHLYAVGGDAEVARMVGIRARAVVVTVFIVSGTLAALAGFVLTMKATVGTPSAGSGLELDAITACVLGGISLSGGRGSLPGAVGGVILLTLIQNVFTLLHISSYFHNVVLAFVILAAVTVFVRRD